jgi:hypothetical protein
MELDLKIPEQKRRKIIQSELADTLRQVPVEAGNRVLDNFAP